VHCSFDPPTSPLPRPTTLAHFLPHPTPHHTCLDVLLVVIGEKVILVPAKAVRQSLDPAGGAQLAAILNELPFWPSMEVGTPHELPLSRHAPPS
jgi:hypothetical protein